MRRCLNTRPSAATSAIAVSWRPGSGWRRPRGQAGTSNGTGASAATVRPGSVEHGAVVVSTAGVASSFPPWIEDWKPKHMICSYDADSAGERAANRIAVSNPRVITLRPCGAEDWNEMLRRR